jgi:hypothetical protein
MFLEAPHKAEKTTKSMIAIYNNGFLPTISDTRPLTGARRVIARVYDFYQLFTFEVSWEAHGADPGVF